VRVLPSSTFLRRSLAEGGLPKAVIPPFFSTERWEEVVELVEVTSGGTLGRSGAGNGKAWFQLIMAETWGAEKWL
jgi:hypothetical protein